ICFEKDVLPVFQNNCAITGCHNGTGESGLILNNYVSISHAVVPGNPSGSKLYKVITSGEEKMPPAGKTQLTSAEIDSIAAWISYGALDQYCGETCDTVSPITFSGTIWPVMQTSCMGCHSGNSPAGSIPLTNYTQVAVIAGNGSLINSLKGNGVPKMPSGGSFSTCRIRQFEIWVNNGYSNN
ncbi:MAG: cytochrome c, partial [Bacteroidia bacterium]|nr:cytochrome c [Bacteroidia bacterium]